MEVAEVGAGGRTEPVVRGSADASPRDKHLPAGFHPRGRLLTSGVSVLTENEGGEAAPQVFDVGDQAEDGAVG